MCRRARQFVLFHDNFDYDASRNGEQALLSALAPHRPEVIFDVGANVGEWSAMAAKACPAARVHAFEVVPDTAAQLAANVRSLPNVVTNAVGLSNEAGRAEAEVRPAESWLSSIVPGTSVIHGAGFAPVSCEVTTGDLYCAARGIRRIDLLKLDVEGAEGLALAGFETALAAGRIDVIQFEYGMANIFSRFLLLDFYRLLGTRGYVIGKLFPNGVRFKNYEPQDEDFRGPNFVAVRQIRQDLVACLGHF